MHASCCSAAAVELHAVHRYHRQAPAAAAWAIPRPSAGASAARLPQRRLLAAAAHHIPTSPGPSPALSADINAACNAALQAMLAADKGQAAQLERRLQALRLRALEEAQDVQADRLLRVVEAMLHHTMLREADSLSGLYAAALNRLVNQVAGSDWKLSLEGQPADAPREEPRFSTWEEVLNKQRQRQRGQGQQAEGSGASSTAGSAGSPGSAGGVADRSYYDLLGVPPSADLPAIKAAYRELALRLHPDVNAAPDAAQRFGAMAAAYDVLSDAAARALYDQFGPDGMKGRPGAGSGHGNASRAWDEFKPFKRQNKHTQARDASTASYGGSTDDPAAGEDAVSSSSSSRRSAATSAEQQKGGASRDESASGDVSGDGWAERWAHLPAAGAVVEYPLPQVVRDELQDGRSHGVGLLVGRNCDRGDARRLPEGVLDLCEVEPLRQEAAGSRRWVPDELSPSAYVRLAELHPIPVDSFDQRFDVWTITAPLSEGCGGPELGEEIIL